MGCLHGLFIADSNDMENLLEKEIYFGEVLGKHSEISGTFEDGDAIAVSDDQDFLDKFVEVLGDGTILGYNPLDYVEEE